MTDKIALPSAPESEQNIFGCLLMVAVRCLLETMAAISWEDNRQEGFGKKRLREGRQAAPSSACSEELLV